MVRVDEDERGRMWMWMWLVAGRDFRGFFTHTTLHYTLHTTFAPFLFISLLALEDLRRGALEISTTTTQYDIVLIVTYTRFTSTYYRQHLKQKLPKTSDYLWPNPRSCKYVPALCSFRARRIPSQSQVHPCGEI